MMPWGWQRPEAVIIGHRLGTENATLGVRPTYGTSVGTTLMLLNGEPLISLVLTTV